MMPNITLGGSPASLQQKGERGAKNAEIDAPLFDAALTNRSGERKANTGDAEDRQMETRQDWKIDHYTALFRLDKTAENKPLAEGPGFDDLLVGQEAANDRQPSPAVEAQAPTDDAAAESEAAEDGKTDADDMAASVEVEKQDVMNPGMASATPPAPASEDPAAKTAERPNSKTEGNQDTQKEQAPAPRGSAVDADLDVQPRTANQPEQQKAQKKQAAHISAAERVTAPMAPADGQSPARTRTDTKSTVTAGIADKSSPAAQQSTAGAQQDATPRPPASPVTVGEASRFVSAKGGSFARDAAPNAPAAKVDPFSAKVNVLNFTAAPAPAPAAPPVVLSATAAGIVAAIETDGTWRAAANDPANSAGPRGAAAPGGVNTLRIQLQPVELGMVTARLVASGSQLSVEIQVESNDARQRLANDSDVIVKALRAVGYDVEKVTIQQAPQGGQSGAQQGGGRNDQSLSDQQGERSPRGHGEQSTAGRDGEGARNGAGETASSRVGGGRYI